MTNEEEYEFFHIGPGAKLKPVEKPQPWNRDSKKLIDWIWGWDTMDWLRRVNKKTNSLPF